MVLFVLRVGMLTFLISTQPAIAYQQKAAADVSESVSLHLRLGNDYLQRGEAEKAIQELKSAVAINPQSAEGHMLLGQAYMALKSASMIAEAKAELQQALDLDPTLIWAKFYLAKIYIDQGRLDKAKLELEQGLQARPNVPHFLSLLGEVNRKLGNPENSIQLNRQALTLDPAMNPAHYFMGLAYMDLRNEDEAIRELEESLHSPHVAPEMYLTLGSLYARKKRYQEGEELCKKAIALDPARPEGRLNLAQLYNLKGASDRALRELSLAIPEGKSYPSSPYYQQLQADVFFEKGRAYQAKRMTGQAIQSYSTSLEFNPAQGRVHRQLAELCLTVGDYPRALRHVSMAEKLGFPVEASLRAEIAERSSAAKPGVP